MTIKKNASCLAYTKLVMASVALFVAPLGVKAANVLTNPGFEDGNTSGWSAHGGSISVATTARSGAYGALCANRTQTWNGIQQSLLELITDGQTCCISGWVRLDNAASDSVGLTVQQTDSNGTNYYPIKWSTGYDDTWTCLSGFFTLDVNGTLTALNMYFEGPVPGVDFYVDDASVQIVSSGDWEAEANERIEQIRKGDFRITAVSPEGLNPAVPDVNVQVSQTKHDFAFGSCINNANNHMWDANYTNFFKNHFEWAVMENESKWYANEKTQGDVNYADANLIYNWCAANEITMRGHCIFWAAEGMVQNWVKALSYAPLPDPSELRTAVENRLASAANNFKGKFLHWDINNEMCDNSFFADRLGWSIRPWMFQAAAAIDPNCMLFVNDYSVVSGGYNLNDYKQLVYDLQTQDAPVHGLGVQCHMQTGFDPVFVKGRFDSLAEANLPIWVTEFDVSQPDANIRANELEDFYRVAFSHPSVEGILMWGFWQDSHWRPDAYIVDSDWTLNAAGIRYESIMDEWTTNDSAVTDANGDANFRGLYGTYSVTLTLGDADPTVTTIEMTPEGPNEFTIELTDLPVPTTCQQVRDFGYTMLADLDGDCQVDYTDLTILMGQWLSTEPVEMPPYYSPDIYLDDQVNLLDFAILSADWLSCNNPEEPDCVPNW